MAVQLKHMEIETMPVESKLRPNPIELIGNRVRELEEIIERRKGTIEKRDLKELQRLLGFNKMLLREILE